MPVQDTADNAANCLCPACPTYDACMDEKDHRLFCARGKTDCDPEARGCICGDCPVWHSNKLEDYYYCLEGPAS
ncbi:MAG: DUF2769 domain-containing protein [Coriobacteriales bacterium]|nr:DUF2769 domain-containing protein [Coriobacteriales bacterium]